MSTSGYNIFIVDDQEEAVTSAKLLLASEGHHVLTATSGEDALALFQPGRIELVILD